LGEVRFGFSSADLPAIPKQVAEEFADASPENILMDLLRALDHGAHNQVAQQSPYGEGSVGAQLGVMEDFLSERAYNDYIAALNNTNNTIMAAFHLQPFLPESGIFILEDGTRVR